jgi:hypothetical protein
MPPSGEKKTAVAFVVLFELKGTFLQISERLREDIEPYFVVSTLDHARQLKAMGVKDERILSVAKSRSEVRRMGPAPREYDEAIREFERYGPTFSSIIMMSRFFRGENSAALMHYMVLTALGIEEFLLRNQVDWVIAEPTNAVEVLTAVVAKKNGIHFGSIGFSRLPHNRLVLFEDIEERGFHRLAEERASGEPEVLQIAETWLKKYREAPSRPAYFKAQAVHRSVSSLIRSAWRNLSLLIGGLTGSSEVNYYRFSDLVRLYSRPYFAWLKRRIIPIQQGWERKGGRPFVVYFLHVSPERSVDVVAPWFSNQLEVIRTIRRALPSHYDLLVKEHPSSTGAQSLSFYRQLRNVPNLVFLSAAIDSRTLIRSAAFVTTISGTTGFEAALLETPAVIFSNVFFRELPLVFRCTSPEQLPELVVAVTAAPRQNDPDPSVHFLADLLANSVASDWNGSGGVLPSQTIDSFCLLLMKAVTYKKMGCAASTHTGEDSNAGLVETSTGKNSAAQDGAVEVIEDTTQ